MTPVNTPTPNRYNIKSDFMNVVVYALKKLLITNNELQREHQWNTLRQSETAQQLDQAFPLIAA